MAKEDQIEEYRFDNRTAEEQREIARQGGIASGKARREKATMLSTLKKLLDEEAEEGLTYRDMATLGLIKGAIKGDSRNYKVMIDLLGEANGENGATGVIMDLVEALKNGKKD